VEFFAIILRTISVCPKAVRFGVTEETGWPLMLSYPEENQLILLTRDKFSVDYKAQFWRPVSASHTQELWV
jgi:hypothetical protein